MEFTSTVLEGLPYRTVRKLGHGHFGEVFLISHLRNSDITAVVKILDVEKVKEEKVLEEFHLQRRLSRAGHENVLNMLWMDRTEESYYLVMEDVEGESLAHRSQKGRIEPAMAQHYFKQVLAGLKFIHGRGIVHGDIKPENLLVTKREALKICDFGSAVQYRYGSEEMLVRLRSKTKAYAAPETLIRGICYEGPPVDVWSAGVSLLVILTGILPWDRADYNDPFYQKWVEWKWLTPEWTKIESLPMRVLRKTITFCVDRWTIESIERSMWMQVNYGPIKKYRWKSSESLD